MRYMLLIGGDETAAKTIHASDHEKIVAAYKKYTDDLMKAGVMLAGDALHDSATAVRISASSGKRKLTDGPFSESKEVIGGYYLIQAKSREEAMEWAARCPAAQSEGRSYVEIREILEFPS